MDGDQNNNHKRRRDRDRDRDKENAQSNRDMRSERQEKLELLESKYGYESAGDETRVGWLVNFSSSSVNLQGKTLSAVKCYFIAEDNSNFKALVHFSPYFYVYARKASSLTEISNALLKQFREQIEKIEVIEKEDLDLKNHLSGKKRYVLKVSCFNVQNLIEVRNYVKPFATREHKGAQASVQDGSHKSVSTAVFNDIDDIREYDVSYHERFAIDTSTRCGIWYNVSTTGGLSKLEKRADLIRWAQPVICAFDIETTKLPLRFPNAEYDQVFMISYMINGKGFLIVNREVVSSDIDDFEYSPKKDFYGSFEIFNEPDEVSALWYFIQHMQSVKPHIYVTYNGDFFDWPFIEKRAAIHGINLYDELGFWTNTRSGECRSQFAIHMDAFYWVKRDSYLPQGSQGLKAVTKAKLGYNPIEVDPEDMVKFAFEHPQRMASYSVSDAVATYFLYKKYVHPFIFSLGTIIPLPPDDVLRKGSGTLCESLLMVQAFEANIIAPNKYTAASEKFFNGRLLESETYIGGHVEALESGVFRADLEIAFNNDSQAYQELIDRVDVDLQYAIVEESQVKMEDVKNYDEVRKSIVDKLCHLRDNPRCHEKPLIYHLDVAAMYPNIILTNRLQPCSIVNEEDCAACDFNTPGKKCLRTMEWKWRGETYAGKGSEYQVVKNQAETESFPQASKGNKLTSFLNLKGDEKAAVLKQRFKKYCQKVYGHVLNKPTTKSKAAGICMRENDFYVNTVQSFRDRRYEYKGLNKKWKGKLTAAEKGGSIQSIKEAEDMVVLYDSLQLAHKCILNSFYGYVMRKGARWYSMEMAGVVTLTGASIIQNACKLVERIGRPLELDTDGIWCCLPGTFPEEFAFETNGKPVHVSYPCAILNAMVAENNKNDQYQSLRDSKTKEYDISSRMTIQFEVDGPYKAMILPAALAEGKSIKKRYAVFDFKGKLVELKGFELKRRGELKLVKFFQEEIFGKFLDGSTLEECYGCVASVANRWLDILHTRGTDLTEDELLHLIADSTTMSKTIEEYGDKRSCAITTALRLNQFLGGDTLKYGSLNCTYVIAKKPEGLPVSDRAIPVTIFKANPAMRRQYLMEWCRDGFHNSDFEISVRDILDWDYYKDRLGKTIQKIITIPAAMQKVTNPVPRVKHPDWLNKAIQMRSNKYKQNSMTQYTTKGTLQDNRKKIFFLGEEGKCEKSAEKLDAPAENQDVEMIDVEQTEQKTQSPTSVIDGLDSRQMNHDEYVKWLKSRKAKWKAKLEKRKMEKKQDVTVLKPQRKVKNMGEFMQRQQSVVMDSVWHIIQFTETENPSELQTWFYIEGSGMHSVKLNIPQKAYLHSSQISQLHGKQSNLSLPHSGSNESVEVDLASHTIDRIPLSDLNVACGTKISSLDLAILELGCVTCMEPEVQKAFKHGRQLKDGISLDEIRMITTAECPYVALQGVVGNIYIYNSHLESRGLLSVTFPQTAETLVVLINPAAAASREITTALLDKMYMQTKATEYSMSFRLQYSVSLEDACNILNSEINNFRASYRGPLLSIYEGPLDQYDLARLIPILKTIPNLKKPNKYADSNYPLMQWQVYASQNLMKAIPSSLSWMEEQTMAAQYAHLPVGNISANKLLQFADIFFARNLRRGNQLPWWGSCGMPDIGGFESDVMLSKEEVPTLEIARPGLYNEISIEFKLHHLAANAITTMVEQMESFENNGEPGEGRSFSAKALTSCSPQVLRIFRGMCQRWLSDAYSNCYADGLLHNVYRWVCDKNSKMYDPTLHQAVRLTINNCISGLVRYLEEQNIKVISADREMMIVLSGKTEAEPTKAFVNSLQQIISKHEKYSLLQLEEVQWFKSLLFKDRFNFAGWNLTSQEDIREGKVFVHFDMSFYLPQLLFDSFTGIVSEFILKLLSNAPVQSLLSQEILYRGHEALEKSKELCRYITEELSDKLLRLLRDSNEGLDESENNLDYAPRSTKFQKDSVLISFVKMLCSVLDLNETIKDEVALLRKNLLRVLHGNEYSILAAHELPCYSLVVNDLVLPQWKEARDIDLLRDVNLSRYLNDYPEDKQQIETNLNHVLQERVNQYNLQDLKCLRTNQVHAGHMCNHSKYGGSLMLSVSEQSLHEYMKDFNQVADFYDLKLVKSTLEWYQRLM